MLRDELFNGELAWPLLSFKDFAPSALTPETALALIREMDQGMVVGSQCLEWDPGRPRLSPWTGLEGPCWTPRQ